MFIPSERNDLGKHDPASDETKQQWRQKSRQVNTSRKTQSSCWHSEEQGWSLRLWSASCFGFVFCTIYKKKKKTIWEEQYKLISGQRLTGNLCCMATTSRGNRDSGSVPNKCIHVSFFFSGIKIHLYKKKKRSLDFTLKWTLALLVKKKQKNKQPGWLNHWCRHNLVLSNREGFVLNTSAGVKIIFLKGWWEVLKGLSGKKLQHKPKWLLRGWQLASIYSSCTAPKLQKTCCALAQLVCWSL